MAYTLEEIKKDLLELDERQFYLKYIVRSENWYFENVLNCPADQLIQMSDDFRMIVSETLGISFNSVLIVGSSKTGYSLSPKEKTFAPFSVSGEDRKISDIDVAIISSELFNKYWQLFRKSYTKRQGTKYQKIYPEIYRGFINEGRITDIPGCRAEWRATVADSKRKLSEKFFTKHAVSYRIYRSWEDFEEYNLKGIQDLKEVVMEECHGAV